MSIDISQLYHDKIRGHRVTTDSRSIRPGDIFIALKGEHFNGNQYAADALAKGAVAAVIDEPAYQAPHCILVPDSLLFLQELAHYHRQQLHIPIIGITGTNGKTTTKELCHAVLSQKYKVQATQGNFNNHIGVPEMGANHPGEIKTLCDIAEPDYGIITNIGQAHLEGFGCYENIIATKKALYDAVFQRQGKVFVHADDKLLMNLTENYADSRYTYGTQGAFLKGEIKQTVPYLVYDLLTPKGHLYIKTHLVGGYNFDNAMAASAIGTFFNIDPLQIQQAIENYHPSNLRSQLIKTPNNTLILDAYNANPSSMAAAIHNFKEMPGEHKIVILGEMLELGQASDDAHRNLLDNVLQGHFEKIFLIGNHFEHCKEKTNFTTWFPDTLSLIAELKEHPLEGKFILVKGSRGNRLEQIVEYL